MNETTQPQQPLALNQVYALVGCGKFGKIHLSELLAAKAKVKYICNKSDAKFSGILKDFDIISKTLLTTNYNEMLEDEEVTAVVIATGPHEHYHLVKSALQHGKHVICEKPFVFELWQAKELYALASSKNLVILVHYSPVFSQKLNSFYPSFVQNIKEGTQLNLFYQNFGLGPEREDYSCSWDYGSHVGAFIYCAGFGNLYKQTESLKFHEFYQMYSCMCSDKNGSSLISQFGNAFSERVNGLTIRLFVKNENGELGNKTSIINLKGEKTIPVLYQCLEFYAKDIQAYKDNSEQFYATTSSYVTEFCLHIESKLN